MTFYRGPIQLQQFLGSFLIGLPGRKGLRHVVAPAFLATFSCLQNQHRPRRKLSDSAINCQGSRCVSKSQEHVERRRVDFWPRLVRRQDRANFRSESKTAVGNPIVNELDPHRVPGHYQALVSEIPNAEAEHAVEMIKDIRPPLFVAVNNYFGIAVSPKTVAAALQFNSQFLVVIDLPVEDDANASLRIEHRLMTTGQIDNG